MANFAKSLTFVYHPIFHHKSCVKRVETFCIDLAFRILVSLAFSAMRHLDAGLK